MTLNTLPTIATTDDLQRAAQLLTALGQGKPVILTPAPTPEEVQQILARLGRGEPMTLPRS